MSKIDISNTADVPQAWFLTVYDLHVFHPGTGQHAGTLNLQQERKAPALNFPRGPSTDFFESLIWSWKGSPYGTANGRYEIWTRRWALIPPHRTANPTNVIRHPAGRIAEALLLTSDRWPQDMSNVHPTDVQPLHPWFGTSDKITLGDNNFVPYPRKPQVTRAGEEAFKWTCKLISYKSKTSPDKIL